MDVPSPYPSIGIQDSCTPRRQSANRWELHADNQHIHWPDLDEDLSVEGLLAGRPSGESERSFKRWLAAKEAGHSVNLYDLRCDRR